MYLTIIRFDLKKGENIHTNYRKRFKKKTSVDIYVRYILLLRSKTDKHWTGLNKFKLFDYETYKSCPT